MTEEQTERGHEQEDERPGDVVQGAPCDRQPEPDETHAEDSATKDTVASTNAQLPPPTPAKIDYQPRPPLRSLSEPPQEPHKRIPVVPPGPFEPDQEDSPPLHLDEAQAGCAPDEPDQTE